MRAALLRLGTRIRSLRHAKALTLELAASGAGLDAKHLQEGEKGKVNVTVASLVGIARALGVQLGALFESV